MNRGCTNCTRAFDLALPQREREQCCVTCVGPMWAHRKLLVNLIIIDTFPGHKPRRPLAIKRSKYVATDLFRKRLRDKSSLQGLQERWRTCNPGHDCACASRPGCARKAANGPYDDRDSSTLVVIATPCISPELR
eukprot:1785808-Pleurochrysis_carterae.AAC.2